MLYSILSSVTFFVIICYTTDLYFFLRIWWSTKGNILLPSLSVDASYHNKREADL